MTAYIGVTAYMCVAIMFAPLCYDKMKEATATTQLSEQMSPVAYKLGLIISTTYLSVIWPRHVIRIVIALLREHHPRR